MRWFLTILDGPSFSQVAATMGASDALGVFHSGSSPGDSRRFRLMCAAFCSSNAAHCELGSPAPAATLHLHHFSHTHTVQRLPAQTQCS